MSATLSSNSPLASPMTGFWRLAWKEYRSIRLFWLLLAAVSVLVQWTTAALWHNEPSAIALIYNFALGAPVFFAVACAGASFAAEREEGTIEFLRAAPISAGQVLASRLAIAMVGTVTMFIVLLPLARMFTHDQLPNDAEWRGMLGLWLVSAVEAIAWGTLFSLLGARPLVAVVLTLVAVSTCDHVLARMNKGPTPEIFEWLAYLRAAPWRGLIALVVLGADFYLGLRWLHGRPGVGKVVRAKRREATATAVVPMGATPKESVRQLQPLLAKRDRSTMFGHLLWQHWRQSRWLMLLMAVLYIALPFVGIGLWEQITAVSRSYRVGLSSDEALLLPIAVISTLIGAMVFLSDQEQRRYRFFAEHNAPPRLIWLSRQLPWIIILLLSTTILCAAWLILFGDAKELLRAIGILTNQWGHYRKFEYSRYLRLPPIGLGIAVAAVGYAAGQISSVLIRSGILAASFALLLSALLFGWTLLMHSMQVSFLWSVVPIPFVLLEATWLRAPDWISENKRWGARGRVAAAVFIPAAALLIAVPFYRVHQIPEVSPGFDVAQYEAELQANLTTGIATADLYRKASDLLSSPPIGLEDRQSSTTIDDQDKDWLTRNEASLKLLTEASSRQTCSFVVPRDPNDLRPFSKKSALTQLILLSARQLEVEGKADAALDRYFVALRVESHLANPGGFVEEPAVIHDVFQQLTYWGARSGQTRERIVGAIKRLQAIDSRILQLDERLKADYLVARRAANGDNAALWFTSGIANLSSEILWLNFMPWERERAERLMNILTVTALRRLDVMRATPMRLVYFCLPRSYPAAKGEFFEIPGETWLNLDIQRDEWLATTVPELWPMGLRGIDAARRLAWFESDRQATIIVLAIEAYRLDHGQLPKSLDQLAGDYLDAVPKDPYSGEAFVYFPTGVTVSHQEIETYSYEMKSYAESKSRLESRFDAERSPPVNPDVPGIWSTGPDISISHRLRTQFDGATLNKGEQQSVLEYELRNGMSRSDRYLPIWMYGDWFGIPAKR